jgi:hypothetical protein
VAPDAGRPLVQVGDIIRMPEADYCYGRGLLTLRVTEVDADLARFPALDRVRLRGVVILWDGTDGDERDVLIRVAALRTQLKGRNEVMGYFAELLWEFGAAEESLAALRGIPLGPSPQYPYGFLYLKGTAGGISPSARGSPEMRYRRSIQNYRRSRLHGARGCPRSPCSPWC